MSTHISPIEDASDSLTQARQGTLHALTQLDAQTLQKLSQLTLPEIRAIQEEIARVLPAGNLPALVLSGLLKLRGRKVTHEQVHQDLKALFAGVELLPRSLYGLLVVTPAAVLYTYQKLLLLAGKDPDDAFPEGAWQFYLEFGLREDTARHANETLGFQRALSPSPDPVVMAAAWVCASQAFLYDYDTLLALDWRERVMLHLLSAAAAEAELGDEFALAPLVSAWHHQRPYHRPGEEVAYLQHRDETFRHFFTDWAAALPAAAQEQLYADYRAREAAELDAYQRQLTLLAALEPEAHHERKVPIPPWRAGIAFVWQGRTYLLPACQRDAQGSPLCFPSGSGMPLALYADAEDNLCDAQGHRVRVDRSGNVWNPQRMQQLGRLRPPDPHTVLSWVASILHAAPTDPLPLLDLYLADSPRPRQPALRALLPADAQTALATLRRAPIVINWDLHARALPLAIIRRGRRGCGDHALTIIQTDESIVFDQSHIFFDGLWGMAVAEILTDAASHAYHALAALSHVPGAPPAPLPLHAPERLVAETASYRQRREAAAESDRLSMRNVQRLRKRLKERGVRLTINDLLLLYRFIHAGEYTPTARAQAALDVFRTQHGDKPEAQAVLRSVEETLARQRETNPALLIPMDASHVAPRERLFPTTFRNPLTDLLARYHAVYVQYQTFANRGAGWETFDESRRELLAYLKAFGELLAALKDVTMRGESFNSATLKLLGHLPPAMQHWLDQIPQRVGMLNEILKGNEVFSNVGRVAEGSTLARFISAKDDGETKTLVWGFLTDDHGVMHISLRDFRPFVGPLVALGSAEMADLLAQDYLDAYVGGLNRFVDQLYAIVTAQPPETT